MPMAFLILLVGSHRYRWGHTFAQFKSSVYLMPSVSFWLSIIFVEPGLPVPIRWCKKGWWLAHQLYQAWLVPLLPFPATAATEPPAHLAWKIHPGQLFLGWLFTGFLNLCSRTQTSFLLNLLLEKAKVIATDSVQWPLSSELSGLHVCPSSL